MNCGLAVAATVVAITLNGCAHLIASPAQQATLASSACKPPASHVGSVMHGRSTIDRDGGPRYDVFHASVTCKLPPLDATAEVQSTSSCLVRVDETMWFCGQQQLRLSLPLQGFARHDGINVYQPDRAAAAVTALRCLVERASLDGKSVASKYGHDMVFDSVNVNDYNVAHVTGVSGLECTTFTVEPDCMTADPAKIVREVHGPERCPVIEE